MGLKLWLGLLVRMAGFTVALLWPAGTWRWWQAWVVIGLWTIFSVAITRFLSRHDPALLAERMKASPVQEGQKRWDKVLMLLMVIPGFGIYVVAGFDVMRFGWSDPLPIWLTVLAMLAHVPGFLGLFWVMRENTFLSRVVKIDDERGHTVITTGPYAWVRHPMYSAALLLVFAVPLALGSRFALIPAALMAVLLIIRTHLEDKTLHTELSGYPDYAQQTRFRLMPGLW